MNRSSNMGYGSICAAVVLLLPLASLGQTSRDADRQSSRRSDESLILAADSGDLVFVEFEVLDRFQRAITDLTYRDFRILDEGAEQEIDFFEKHSVVGVPPAEGKYLIGYYRSIKKDDSIRVRVTFKDERLAKHNRFRIGIVDVICGKVTM
jgi:hypothetical protein